MATNALRWCMKSFSAPIPADDIGWQSLAEVHALDDVDIEELMRCCVVRIVEDWQLALVTSQLRGADDDGDPSRLMRLLCTLVRAELREGLKTTEVEDVTLRIALRQEERVSHAMASCVRVARVLACKLDAMRGLSQICEGVDA